MKNKIKILRANSAWRPEVKRFWYDVLNEFEIEPSLLMIFKTAADALQRLLDARDLIDKQGLTFETETGIIRKNPATEIEKVSRIGFLQAFKSLGLDYNVDDIPKRPAHRPIRGTG